MQKLDRQLQRRVWARVYGGQPVAWTDRQRQALERARNNCRKNLALYERMTSHALYAEAFHRLAEETKEHIKMLNQILG